jgi:CTP:molybdopterin cytidylyltransferase MocA
MTKGKADEAPAVPFTTVVTAAGAGQRMGGPKALLAVRWGEGSGELPLAIAHAKAHLDGGAERIVVVARAEVARTLSRFAQRGLDIVVSSQAEALGPAGSIRCALTLLELDPDAWVLIVPVDMPPISISIRRELLGAAARSPAPAAVRPVFEGKRGHPILVRRRHLEPFLDASPPSLRDVLAALGDQVVDVAVDDRRAITDFATPADVQEFYGRPARFFIEDEPTLA